MYTLHVLLAEAPSKCYVSSLYLDFRAYSDMISPLSLSPPPPQTYH